MNILTDLLSSDERAGVVSSTPIEGPAMSDALEANPAWEHFAAAPQSVRTGWHLLRRDWLYTPADPHRWVVWFQLHNRNGEAEVNSRFRYRPIVRGVMSTFGGHKLINRDGRETQNPELLAYLVDRPLRGLWREPGKQGFSRSHMMCDVIIPDVYLTDRTFEVWEGEGYGFE